MKKEEARILIIDDDEFIRLSLKMLLEQYYSSVTVLEDPKKLTTQLNENKYDVALLDMNFRQGDTSGKEGLYWLERILTQSEDTNVILITAYADINIAVDAIKKGAMDFIIKPWQNEKILATINTALKLNIEKKKVKNLTGKAQALSSAMDTPFIEIIGNSGPMQQVFKLVDKVAGTDANVLILGENGTGKELIARDIHRKSLRKGEIFINVDVGALSDSLFESELFGHKKGAFTDAKEDRIGKMEAASGGTFFMDEIGNISLNQQSKLLAALQNRQVVKIGSNDVVPIDIRLVCATNSEIHHLVKDREFREDLLYRINTVEIKLPPLRERTDDIPQLVNHFLSKYGQKYGKEFDVPKSVLTTLMRYPWHGNVRELQHAIERAVILADSSKLSENDFSFLNNNSNNSGMSFDDLNLENLEEKAITEALKRHGGNVSTASKELGLSRGAMYRRMEKYGL